MHDNIYVPKKSREPLQLTEDAEIYDYRSTITLEWPAQSIRYFEKNKIVCGMNGRENSLLLIEFIDENVQFKKIESDAINRLEVNKFIFAVSDGSLMKFNENRCLKKIEGNFDYGLFLTPDRVFSSQGGEVFIFDYDLNLMHKFSHHAKEINSIFCSGNILFTGSNDGTFKIYDLEKESLIHKEEMGCDVNALAYSNNILLVGLDDASICIFDCEKLSIHEKILWHKNPINYIKFIDETSFVSTSDEQIALFDLDFEGTWDFHKYLYFIHQGEEQYRELDIQPESLYNGEPIICAASQNGLVLFRKIGIEE